MINIEFELSRKSNSTLRKGNQMLNANDRPHFMEKNNVTQFLRSLAFEKGNNIDELFSKENPCFIIVEVCPPTNRRMDAPNWYPTVKALMDGLTDAHVFEDDNDDIISAMVFVRGEKTTTKKYKLSLKIYNGKISEYIKEGL